VNAFDKGELSREFEAEGNTLITEFGNNQTIEVDSAGNIVWQKTGLIVPHDAERLSNGNTLITEVDGDRVIEVDTDGNIIVWQKTGLLGPMDVERLSNGNTLITEYGAGRLIEVDTDGDIIWSKTGLSEPKDAERLSNGNTLIAELGANRVIEVDTDGNIVWSKTGLYWPTDVERFTNQPPSVEFINPREGYFHFSGIPLLPTPLDLIADTMSLGGFRLRPVLINATDDFDNSEDLIVKVYLNGEEKGVASYCCNWKLHEWFWTGFSFGTYQLKVTAEDTSGNVGSVEMGVWNLCFLPQKQGFLPG